jgi:hypothetical protein
MRKFLLFSLLTVAIVFGALAIVNAPPVYNYDVISNYHGVDTPLGANVVVTATTDDPTITQVTFLWKNGAKEIKFTDVVPISGGSAQSSNQPDSIGDWGVQAFFQGPDGTTKEGIELTVQIRATSFNVIPEIPIVGTAGASIAMLFGFACKIKRKRK